ncbi:uncharacterized protein LOC121374176 [Gigantopelta aegis]|uniref:uncharacterized protein LOC121374176 n=1 Tax=Gigantopelta aegis TaxID=1735272 RepID=UPI001B88DA4A|nr:uncharacterized protein LOC121374176 [Gigantopelta aegis]
MLLQILEETTKRRIQKVMASATCKNKLVTLETVLATLSDSEEEIADDSDNDPDYIPNADNSVESSDEHSTCVFEVHSNTVINSDKNKKARGRKRKRDESAWKRKYCTERNRIIGPSCNLSCKKKCGQTFTTAERNAIFTAFWSMGVQQRRRDFIVSHVTRSAVNRKTKGANSGSRRKRTLVYTLPKDGNNVSVCKQFFMHTLDISDQMVNYNISHSQCGLAKHTLRKGPPANKTPKNLTEDVIRHINTFPRIESHYCRADTSKEYLEAGLNVKEMHRLYKTVCIEQNNKSVSLYMYRHIFDTHFNMGFHTPKKDLCDTCEKYRVKEKYDSNSLTEDEKASHALHLKRKLQARESKMLDKEAGEGTITAAFDLQQVMISPKLNVGSAYYLRKLNVYNLTIMELQTLQGFCYTWHEAECKRGSNEIATSLLKWLKLKDEQGYQQVILYSDSCGGQNRN